MLRRKTGGRGGVEFRRSCLRACDGWRFRSDVCETTVGPWARPPLGASGGPEPENESDPETASNLQQSLRGPNIIGRGYSDRVQVPQISVPLARIAGSYSPKML